MKGWRENSQKHYGFYMPRIQYCTPISSDGRGILSGRGGLHDGMAPSCRIDAVIARCAFAREGREQHSALISQCGSRVS
jgi:hypothetical protein